MILRVFRARIYPDKREQFARFFHEEAMPETRKQPGLIDCWIGEPLTKDEDEFVFVSVWKDLAALTAFRPADLDDPGIQADEADVIRSAEVGHYSTDLEKRDGSSV